MKPTTAEHTIYAIASNANGVSADTRQCQRCGGEHAEPSVECHACAFADQDEPHSHLEQLQWGAEEDLHRTRGRYMRGLKPPRNISR